MYKSLILLNECVFNSISYGRSDGRALVHNNSALIRVLYRIVHFTDAVSLDRSS